MTKNKVIAGVIFAVVAAIIGGLLYYHFVGMNTWIEYSNDAFHYKIDYPSNWSKEVQYNGVMVSLMSSGPKNRTLMIGISERYDNSLDDFVEEEVYPALQAQTLIYDDATLSVENTALGGRESRLLDIRNLPATIDEKEYILRQKYVVTFIYVNGAEHPLSLLFTAEMNDSEAWDDIFTHIVESFEFT